MPSPPSWHPRVEAPYCSCLEHSKEHPWNWSFHALVRSAELPHDDGTGSKRPRQSLRTLDIWARICMRRWWSDSNFLRFPLRAIAFFMIEQAVTGMSQMAARTVNQKLRLSTSASLQLKRPQIEWFQHRLRGLIGSSRSLVAYFWPSFSAPTPNPQQTNESCARGVVSHLHRFFFQFLPGQPFHLRKRLAGAMKCGHTKNTPGSWDIWGYFWGVRCHYLR